MSFNIEVVLGMGTSNRRRDRPPPSSPAALRRMQSTRQHDTAAELTFRSALWRSGLRGYRVNRRPLKELRRTADLVFPRHKIAVFVDGCFWHGCPQHGTAAKAHAQWWRDKIAANRVRDVDTNRRLTDAGWTVIRVWGHSEPMQAAQAVRAVLRGGRPTASSTDVKILAPAVNET
jgi:DNA mismatch endonuclease (patch repair protein)